MGNLPCIESDFTELTRLFFNAFGSRLLITAAELEVFGCLEKPMASEAVAAALNTHRRNTEVMLNALCACGLVRKENGLFRNRRLASDFLVRGKPAYMGEWLMLADAASRPVLDGLTDRVRKGPGQQPEEEHMNAEAYCEGYTASHAATSLAGIARDMATHIAALPAFKDCRTMLDLGGGPAINAMALAQANPRLRATVLDRPAIARMAREYIESYGFSDRVSARGGDYLKDSLGDGYDLIMITDSLYYAEEQVDLLIRKCREALHPGGMLVGIHAVLTHERTRPSHSVLGMLAEAMTGQGDLPDQGFMEQALVRCGFDRIISRMVPIGYSIMEMNVGHLKATAP